MPASGPAVIVGHPRLYSPLVTHDHKPAGKTPRAKPGKGDVLPSPLGCFPALTHDHGRPVPPEESPASKGGGIGPEQGVIAFTGYAKTAIMIIGYAKREAGERDAG